MLFHSAKTSKELQGVPGSGLFVTRVVAKATSTALGGGIWYSHFEGAGPVLENRPNWERGWLMSADW